MKSGWSIFSYWKLFKCISSFKVVVENISLDIFAKRIRTFIITNKKGTETRKIKICKTWSLTILNFKQEKIWLKGVKYINLLTKLGCWWGWLLHQDVFIHDRLPVHSAAASRLAALPVLSKNKHDPLAPSAGRRGTKHNENWQAK